MSQSSQLLSGFFFRSGIRRWLTAWGLGLVGAALGLITLAGSIYTRRQIEHSTAAFQAEVASLTARHIQTYIARKIERLRDTATGLSLYGIGDEEQKVLLNLLLKNDRSFGEISVIDHEGHERLRVSDRQVYFDADLRDFRGYLSYETAMRGMNHISPVFTSDRAEPYLVLAVPLTSVPRKVVGVVLAQTNMQFLWDLMREEKFGRAGFMYLVNERGRLIAHKDPALVLESRDVSDIPKVAEFLDNPGKIQGPGTIDLGFNGNRVLSSYAVVRGLGWAVVVEEPVEFALADLEKLEAFTSALLVAGLFVGGIIIVFLSNRITAPLLKLRDGANIIEKGNLNHRVEIDRDDEIGELGARFNQMAAALKNSYETLETKVELRTRELAALYDVTTTINQTLDIETVLDDIIKKVTSRFNFVSARVFLFDGQFEKLSLRASYTCHDPLELEAGCSTEEQPAIGAARESCDPALLAALRTAVSEAQELSPNKNPRDPTAVHFFAALPIKTKTQLFGVAEFSSGSPRELKEHEVRLLKAICEQLAVAVERTRFFEELTQRSEALQQANEVLKTEIVERKRAQEEVLRQHRRISSLHEIGAAINSTLDQGVLLETLTAKAKALLPYSAVSVSWREAENNKLVSLAQRYLNVEVSQSEAVDMPQNHVLELSEMILTDGEALLVEDSDLDPRPALAELLHKDGWKGFIGLPLTVEGKVLGALAFYLRDPHRFPPEEVEFLATLASQVAIAIFNSVLYENSRKQAVDLEKAIHAKDEFLNVMSHELRTPLSVIGGYAQAMSVGVAGDINPEQQKIAEKIITQSNELLRMINEILQVGSLQAGSVQAYIQNTNLHDLFRELQNIFAALPKDGVELIWDIPADLPLVATDSDKLKHVLQNLIHNAMKFTEQGSVTLSARCVDDQLEMAVRDTGIGIEPEKLPTIFDMFRQVDSSRTRSHGGVGVGLFIVKKYVELLNGTIEVKSFPGEGTVFTVRLPIHQFIGLTETEPQQVVRFMA